MGDDEQIRISPPQSIEISKSARGAGPVIEVVDQHVPVLDGRFDPRDENDTPVCCIVR